MQIVRRGLQFMRGALLSYGPQGLKRRVWNTEYRNDKWPLDGETGLGCVRSHLERYARGGKILDLGCGSGNTATELSDSAYERYLGVDISEVALEKARVLTRTTGRERKTHFDCSDFLAYVPDEQFDVILFRESMYHVPLQRLHSVLNHYSRFLSQTGVFIVRMYTACAQTGQLKNRPVAMLSLIESEFEILEKRECAGIRKPTVLVFRPHWKARPAAPTLLPGNHVSTA